MKPILAVLALSFSVPLFAQPADEPLDVASMSDAELGERLAAAQPSGLFNDSCRIAKPLFGELVRRHPDDERSQTGHLVGEAFCAADEKRFAEGLSALKRAEEIGLIGSELDPLGLFFAGQLEDGGEALARIRSLAASRQLAEQSLQTISIAARTIESAGLSAELAKLSFEIAGSADFAKLEPDMQSLLAERALQYAAANAPSDRAGDLLAYIRSPYQIEDLLALREYEPLWPQVERYAGDNLANVSDSYVSWAATHAADMPEDRDRLSDYAYALLFAGRDREAIALAENWIGSRQYEGPLEEGDGWALNIQAYAYDALGQPAEGDRVFDRLAKLSADEHPWVVNFVINRASRLTGLGRWSEALAASDLAKPVAEKHGSPYARMLVASYRACALHKLGRVEESEDELEIARSQGSDAPAAAASALICAGHEDDAADLLAKVLADETVRSGLLGDLQDERFDLFGSPLAVHFPGIHALVASRPELREQALEYVRFLPDHFVPIAYLRRQGATPEAAD